MSEHPSQARAGANGASTVAQPVAAPPGAVPDRADIAGELTASRLLEEGQQTLSARLTVWAVLTGLCLFLVWASQTPIYEMISGSGSIQPDGLAQRIEHPEGGVVSHIAASSGTSVRKGDLLVVLDTRDIEAEIVRLSLHIDLLDRRIASDRALIAADLSAADPLVDTMLADQSLPRETRYRLAQIRVMQASRAASAVQRQSLVARRAKALQELEIVANQVARYETAGSNGVVFPVRQIEELTRNRLRLEGEVGNLEGEIESRLAADRLSLAQEAELVEDYKHQASMRLQQDSAERAAILPTLAQLEDRLARAQVRASADGVIQHIAVRHPGEVVGAGELIAEIVPDNGTVFVEAEIPADKIGGVQAGQAASLKILTYDFTRFGDIEAQVESVSPSSFETPAGQMVFRVRLSMRGIDEDGGSPRLDPYHPISPGMTVAVDIKSESRTVLSYLVKPVRVLADRALRES